MKNKKIARLLIFILLLGSVLSMGYMVYSATSNYIEKLNPAVKNIEAAAKPITIRNENTKREVLSFGLPPAKKELVVTKEMEDKIIELDRLNSEKNIKNYRDALKNLKATEKFQKKMEDMFRKGHRVPDVLIAYEFLYDNFGALNELEELLNKKNGGKDWASIFKEYNKNEKVFTPSSFKTSDLEYLMESKNLTPDDIMMADRISQKGLGAFAELVNKRTKGWDWQNINSELGIINTSGSFPKVAVDKRELEAYIGSTGLTKQQIVKGYILAAKTGKPQAEIIGKLKAGSREEDIIAQYYSEKYGR